MDDKEVSINYKNEEITVVWKPKVCTHSKKCWKELGDVFKPMEKPWVKIDGAATERIIEQINACPSGALNYRRNEK